ncbi:MAG: hypothetical protein ABIB41_02100 [Nitrospirota bacterium]
MPSPELSRVVLRLGMFCYACASLVQVPRIELQEIKIVEERPKILKVGYITGHKPENIHADQI